MKKFRLYSAAISKTEGIVTVENTVGADSYADVIEYIESNAGWYTADNGAFKVAYIEEIVD
ncbi:hypothetical protein [Lactococcus cremoris]|uniref:hypothetical protein n=1 Tax=Lactococcus lactis subsp. cremoris TaxID=1359 RepID=UPI0003AB4D6B|nr:hypothetical protein [Lactococcus cremoris]AGV73765.1 phage-related protein [Lactococcus cremoris subsp. cremoris KW2]